MKNRKRGNIMKYLVEIILDDSITPIFNYYSTLEKAMKDIKNMTGVVDVTVYKFDPFNSKVLLNKVNGKEKGGML